MSGIIDLGIKLGGIQAELQVGPGVDLNVNLGRPAPTGTPAGSGAPPSPNNPNGSHAPQNSAPNQPGGNNPSANGSGGQAAGQGPVGQGPVGQGNDRSARQQEVNVGGQFARARIGVDASGGNLQGQIELNLPGGPAHGPDGESGNSGRGGPNFGPPGQGAQAGSAYPGNGLHLGQIKHAVQSELAEASSTASSAARYLTGRGDGASFSADTRQVLNQVLDTAGARQVGEFLERGGEPARQFVDRVLTNASQTADNWGGATRLSDAVRQQVANELTSVIQLDRHFATLEAAANHTVAAARVATLGLLAADAARETGNTGLRASAAEMLRDLRAGAFLPPALFDRPMTLTEAAAISREMLALLRALEAMMAGEIPGLSSTTLAAIMKLIGQEGMSEQLAGLLPNPGPALPGIAGRFEMLRFISLLNGQLLDAKGNPMMKAEGLPLKLDEMLWFSLLGGLVHATPDESRFAARLSPLVLYGFDAIFSLVGFDGRALALPRYLAVQVQVNSRKEQSAFGQVPFSEGWIRALIERLKDASLPEHNFLGEQLEEALTDERFFLATLGGKVEAGRTVPGSFALTPVAFDHAPAQGFSTGFAFA